MNCRFIDGCDHGTHVAGIVAANGAVRGVAGGANLVSIQVFSRSDNAAECNAFGRPTPCVLANYSDIVSGLDRVNALASTGTNLTAVNMSLGGGAFPDSCDAQVPQAFNAAVANLVSRRVAVVASAGNNNSTTGINAPACQSQIIAVGNVNKSDGVDHAAGNGTNSSDLLRFWAPGVQITSTCPGNATCVLTGTSMSAPHVAGAYAVLRQALSTATVAELTQRLESTGTLITDTLNMVARPRINIGAALGIPGLPQNVFLVPEFCQGNYTLEWAASSGNPTHYQVYRSGTGTATGTQIYSGPALSHFFSAVANSYIRVRACNNSGCGAFVVRGPTQFYTPCQ